MPSSLTASYLKSINFSLGIPGLLSEWKALFSRKYLVDDAIASITVALVAIPLSLAIALASGLPPATGLVTAIIAGIVCALFGGTPLAVSGPAAAMVLLVADSVDKFGAGGLVIICLLAGIMQLISGMLGLGKLARYVPFPVIAGFTAGIGVIIIIGQLPRAFGLLPPSESHVFDVFKHLTLYFKDMNVICLLLVVLTFAIIRGLPKIFPRVSPILPAVALTTAIVYFFHLKSIPLIGNIPRSLPAPHLALPKNIPFLQLLLSAFSIYLLASLETLLSSTAIDKLSNAKKHDSNQELIGQGLGNIAVSFFHGMPVTGVIVRSITNLRAGAKTRRSSIFHSLIILSAIFFIAPLISLIPIAALAAILFSVALSMINYKEFYSLWRTARSEAVVYGITFFTIIFTDLIAGVQVGLAAAGMIVLFKAAQTRLYISKVTRDNVMRFSLAGAFTFISTSKIIELEKLIESAKAGQIIILDLSSIDNMDISGASVIIDLHKYCKSRDIKFYIKGLPTRFEPLFEHEGKALLEEHYLISENELRDKEMGIYISAHDQLVHGVQRFYAERKRKHRRLFDTIALQQNPHTLFITCSDSRIVPSMITSSDPGELFVIRNVGNFIPPYQTEKLYSETAALEFAFNYLNISDIVVCGHTNCGAMRACHVKDNAQFPLKLQTWINMVKLQLDLEGVNDIDELARRNVLNQIQNLAQYPFIQERLKEERLKIHGWVYNFIESKVYEWHSQEKVFKPIS